MLHSIGIDMTDMVRGDGEWKNMQDVVRNSFRMSFELLDNQQKSMSNMTSLMQGMRDHVSGKLEEADVKAMLSNMLPTDVSHVRRDDYECLEAKVAALSADVARKASTKYVDDSMRRKVDRTDVLLRSAPHLSSGEEVARLKEENGRLNTRLEAMERKMADLIKTVEGGATREDVAVLRSQVDQLYEDVGGCVSRREVESLVDKKVDVLELEASLQNKADKPTVSAAMSKLEQTLVEHEKLLTALRLSAAEGNSGTSKIGVSGDVRLRKSAVGFGSVTLGEAGASSSIPYSIPCSPHFGASGHYPLSPTKSPQKRGNSRSRSRGRSRSPVPTKDKREDVRSPKMAPVSPSRDHVPEPVDGAQEFDENVQENFDFLYATQQTNLQTNAFSTINGGEGGGLNGRLRDMQTEAVISALWQKMSKMERLVGRDEDVAAALEDRLVVIEKGWRDVITKHMLANKLIEEKEEQTAENMASKKFREVVTQFLGLPQKRSLGTHLDQVGALIDQIQERQAETNSVVGGLSTKLDQLDATQHLLDARTVMLEENAERIIALQRHCDVSSSGFDDLAQLGACVNSALTKVDVLETRDKSIEALFRALETRLGETHAGAAATDKTARYLYTRIEGWENQLAHVKRSVEGIKAQLTNARDVSFAALGATLETAADMDDATPGSPMLPQAVVRPFSSSSSTPLPNPYATNGGGMAGHPVVMAAAAAAITSSDHPSTPAAAAANPASLGSVNARLAQLRAEKERLQTRLLTAESTKR